MVIPISYKSARSWFFFCLWTGLGCLLVYLFVAYIGLPKRVGTIAFSTLDIKVYFESSDWVVGGGRLYQEVLSEYPPLANFIFAIIRFLSEKITVINNPLGNFIWLWMTAAWIVYALIAFAFYAQPSKRKFLWLILTPTILYYTVYRYDIYPALFTFLSLYSIRRSNYRSGSLLLGIVIALKGYALFLLPSYLIYIYQQKGKKETLQALGFTLLPFVVSHLVILFISGVDGVWAPYLFHAERGLNGESTYDTLIHFTNFRFFESLSNYPQITRVIQCSMPLLLIFFVPRCFDDLVSTFLLIILWFISFSIFYSPQFILWVFPIICFSRSKIIFYLSLGFSILTFFYYPLSEGAEISIYEPLLLILIIRFIMIYLCFKALWKNFSLPCSISTMS